MLRWGAAVLRSVLLVLRLLLPVVRMMAAVPHCWKLWMRWTPVLLPVSRRGRKCADLLRLPVMRYSLSATVSPEP